ncbi:MAG: oxygen-independent coproporphyrinogen III oxidase [Pseudomonadota bacterium]|nr:oxygen-independent coproporphyrinogen III oxidase [Pseudomonadota bacterium]
MNAPTGLEPKVGPELHVPEELVARYRTRAPRYTSYPTAPQFGPIPTAAIDAALRRNPGPLSAYVHIPFCKSLCHYCGCHVEIHARREIGAGYVDTVLAEADLLAARLQPGRTLDQLALGGGTPTFLQPDDMARLIDGLRARWPFTPTADISIEVDPRTIDEAYLNRLVDIGFGRYSFGVQDFDATVLEAVHRAQPADLTLRAVRTLRERGEFDLNFDLMYGLPHQTPETFRTTLDIVVAMRPTRIALFLYAHVPWMKPAQKLVEKHGIPDAAARSRLFVLANEVLAGAGYERIGMDHFALPGDDLLQAQASGTLQRNFMGYTSRAGLDQVGMGVSAIGSFGGVYAQDLKDREAWTARIAAGELPIERGFLLTEDDLERRRVIMQLFCNFTIQLEPGMFVEERERLAPMVKDGFVVLTGDNVTVTPLGRHFIRNVCAVFDRYLEADAAARRYSHTA